MDAADKLEIPVGHTFFRWTTGLYFVAVSAERLQISVDHAKLLASIQERKPYDAIAFRQIASELLSRAWASPRDGDLESLGAYWASNQ